MWTKQWYAVSPLDYLDGKRPYPIKVMGKDLVIWKSKAGEWSCLEDRCSHRLAPLSGAAPRLRRAELSFTYTVQAPFKGSPVSPMPTVSYQPARPPVHVVLELLDPAKSQGNEKRGWGRG